jgi:glucose-1-phosphate cytidylyltransferase
MQNSLILLKGGHAMKVVVLCGGYGTRMLNETEYRPKPLVDIGGRPILWHIMKLYAHFGFQNFVLCLGYRGTMIKEYFLNYEAINNDFTISLGRSNQITYHDSHDEQGFTVTLVDTGLDTMTGGRIRRVRDHIGAAERFMVTYGDGLSDVHIPSLLSFHEHHGKVATMTTVNPFSRFGCVETGEADQVTKFREKGRIESWVNAGFFVFEPALFDYLEGDDTVLEAAPLEKMASDRELMAYRHRGFFFAMDTPRDHLQLSDMMANKNAPWMIWEKPNHPIYATSQNLTKQVDHPIADA